MTGYFPTLAPCERKHELSSLIVICALFICAAVLLGGCVSHRMYNAEPEQYLQQVDVEGGGYDLGIIEFDDHGTFWEENQLEDIVALIERRNREAENGILVLTFVHGWQNNADPKQTEGDLLEFRETLERIARNFANSPEDARSLDRVVGVYLGWRGATSRIPLHNLTTFWDRRATAERVVSLNLREAFFRVMEATKSKEGSKGFIVGHSMGGLIVGRALSPSLTTLMLSNGAEGTMLRSDLVVMMNSAVDALSSWQFIDFLKRSNASLELRHPDGSVEQAPGPAIVSITSEADSATGFAYPISRRLSTMTMAFRGDHENGQPSQRYLATHTEGHVDYLVSHRAWVEDGEVRLERIPDAFNDTPFWVIRVTEDISASHNDTRNPMMGRLVEMVADLNGLYETDIQTWMVLGDQSSGTR